MEILVGKEDLQHLFKNDLIEEVLNYELVNEETKEPYLEEELDVLSYNELVELLVDSKKVFVSGL